MSNMSTHQLTNNIAIDKAYEVGYNQAISDVLAAIEDENKVAYTTTPTGFKVLYKETLKNVIKSLKK